VEGLTSHLRRLAQDRALVRRMGEASRRRAREFSWDAAAQRYIEIFRQLTCVSSLQGGQISLEAKHKV